MSEPRAHATRTVEVVPGIRRWSVRDDRIGGADSEAYAVLDDDGAVVLVDPLPLSEGALNALGPVTAIVLTA
ncbi:MAG: MBL fold metallo-hydrolase, partial [Myxococcaceae bacterium]|nr:MBL fold metallo-hydrolase [Myxococcaceae bacterium]